MNNSNEKPNILLILTDQQRFDTIAALGNTQIRTPVLDRLAGRSVNFRRAYTPSPVCVAARCSLVTGLSPHRTGCNDNMPMPQDVPSFMDHLSGAGYQTHGVGKMHFTPDHQRMWGFGSRDVAEELKEHADDFKKYLSENGYGHVDEPNGIRSEYYYIPQPSQLPAPMHQTAWVADRSIDFLKQRDKDRPFFLWSSFIKPHPPFETPTPWNKLYRCFDMDIPCRPEEGEDQLCYWNRVQNRYKYKDAGHDDLLLRTMRAAYYSAISFIDYHVGRILDELGPEADNTLIVFTSDHGEYLGDYGCVGKRGMHEVSSRVPLLVQFPQAWQAGSSSDVPVSLIDLYPTFLSAAGVSPGDCDGTDLQAVVEQPQCDRGVISQFSAGLTGLYMITNREWKYVYSAADRREWLWNLRDDPRETRDLANNIFCQETLKALRDTLITRLVTDGYEEPVCEGRWRRFPQPRFPVGKDAGLLIQDPYNTEERLKSLGPDYYRPATTKNLNLGQVFFSPDPGTDPE